MIPSSTGPLPCCTVRTWRWCVESWAALVLWLLGYPDQALQTGHEAIALAQELAHPYSLIYALNWMTMAPSLPPREASRPRAGRGGAGHWSGVRDRDVRGVWNALAGLGAGGAGQPAGRSGEEGMAQMRQGLAAWRATGAGVFRPYYLALLAEAYGAADRPRRGSACG